MKALGCHNLHPDICIVPLHYLTKMVHWPETSRAVFAAIDRDGMRNPLIAFVVKPGERKWDEINPTWIDWPAGNQFCLAVKYGNQRIRYAELRGFTHVAVVLVATERDCIRWLVNYRDEVMAPQGLESAHGVRT